MRATTACVKKRRECYCGNLAQGEVTQELLRHAIGALMQQLPAFAQAYPHVDDPVRGIAFPENSRGTFAFVEMFDAVLASTVVNMTGFELRGRLVKVGRPRGYSPGLMETPPLDVEPLRLRGLLPAANPAVVLATAAGPGTRDRARELHIENLLVDNVTESTMIEFLRPICAELPDYVRDQGPLVTRVTMASNGTHCFVQFQSAEMASYLIPILDGTELMGRRLRVVRPSAVTALAASASASSAAVFAGAAHAGPSEAVLAGAAAAAGLCL